MSMPASRGQALPLGLFFLFATAAVTLFMFNTGRAVDEKLRITNAADAAAYSAAILEARALNYDAYANRAMVANEVAIAQAVSLSSWIHYFESGVNNVGTLADVAGEWIYYPQEYPKLAQLLAILGGTAYLNAWSGGSLEEIVEYLDYALAGIGTMHNAAAEALSASQTVLHASLTAGVAQQRLADEIAKKIDPAMSAELVLTSHGFDGFTRRYGRGGSGGDERKRLADVTLDSRDTFTRERSWTIEGPDIFPLQRNVALKRRGGTDLIDYDEWRGLDTLEHEGQRLSKGRWRWQRTPIAGGGAEVDTGGGDAGRGFHGGSYRDNPETSKRLAEPNMADLKEFGGVFTGIPESRDLADLSASGRSTTGLTIRVAKPREDLRTSGGSSIVQPSGRLAQFGSHGADGEMSALARAEVFFERPVDRADGKTERPSLYNPYWQVRLTNPTADDRAYAAARQGGMLLP